MPRRSAGPALVYNVPMPPTSSASQTSQDCNIRILLMFGSLSVSGLTGCGQDIKVSEVATCDGRVEGTEESVDSPFDADQDGYFDGGNPDCQETYAETLWDCDDQNPDINPGVIEVPCNGVDDDCDEATPDSEDEDGDGANSCLDCDDTRAEVNPSQPEVVCDGYDNDCDDATVDEEDVDGDGYGSCSDCADGDPTVSPGTAEITCNGIDDDCNTVTVDGPDIDADGESTCTDCDDMDAARSNTFTEICDDGIDNDCDGEVDDGCEVDYTGTYTLATTSSYSCTFGIVNISVNQLTVIDSRPVISFSARGSEPGTMTGTLDSFDAFNVSNSLSGTCTEDYALVGSFVSTDHFTGTFTATFTPSRPGNCYDCVNQSWTVDGYR